MLTCLITAALKKLPPSWQTNTQKHPQYFNDGWQKDCLWAVLKYIHFYIISHFKVSWSITSKKNYEELVRMMRDSDRNMLGETGWKECSNLSVRWREHTLFGSHQWSDFLRRCFSPILTHSCYLIAAHLLRKCKINSIETCGSVVRMKDVMGVISPSSLRNYSV